MNRSEFITELQSRLQGVPQEDIKRSVDYYSEMIDDRVEDGMEEAEAVAALGSMEEIITQILSEVSLPKLVKEKVKPKRALKAWEIVLLILGAPLWIPICLTLLLLVLTFYLIVWDLIISLYSLDLVLLLTGLVLEGLAIGNVVSGNGVVALFLAGVGLILMGLSVLLFFVFNLATKGILFVSKKIVLGVKSLFIKK